jgi:hypothetical protein
MHESIERRDATRRTAAVAALAGLAIAQLAALPYALVQGPQIAAVSAAAIAVALGLGTALARAGADGGRAAWRGIAALGVLTACGWAVTRAVAVPGVAEDAGHWTTTPGLPAAVLGIALAGLGAAASGMPSGPRGLLAAARVAVVGLALVPAPAIALVALGPAPVHHHDGPPLAPTRAVLTHPAHAPADLSGAAARFRPGFGGHAGRYVYANARRPHLPPWALALALGAAATWVSLAAGAPRGPSVRVARERRITAA